MPTTGPIGRANVDTSRARSSFLPSVRLPPTSTCRSFTTGVPHRLRIATRRIRRPRTLSQGRLPALEIVLPPLDDQRRIAVGPRRPRRPDRDRSLALAQRADQSRRPPVARFSRCEFELATYFESGRRWLRAAASSGERHSTRARRRVAAPRIRDLETIALRIT